MLQRSSKISKMKQTNTIIQNRLSNLPDSQTKVPDVRGCEAAAARCRCSGLRPSELDRFRETFDPQHRKLKRRPWVASHPGDLYFEKHYNSYINVQKQSIQRHTKTLKGQKLTFR